MTGIRRSPDPGGHRSLVRAFLISAVGAVVLSWPMLIVSAPLVFPDTANYIQQGGELLNSILRLILPDGAIAWVNSVFGLDLAGLEGGALRHDAADAASRSVRSAPYSIFLHVGTHAPLPPAIPAFLQSFIILFMFLAVIPRRFEAPRLAIWAAAAFCVFLTSWPWFASYLMPDILTAGVILYGAWLVRDDDGFGRAGTVLLCAFATFCVLSHYGNIPLAAAAFAAALGLLALGRRLTASKVVLAAIPVVLAVIVNVSAGLVLYDGASAAPRRLPVMLARSFEDGPARWHLEERCRTERAAICDFLAESDADSVGDFLWSDHGVTRLEREKLEEIREQEVEILLGAVRDYPLRQAASFIRNGADQFSRIGLAEIWPADISVNEWGTPRLEFDRDRLKAVLGAFGTVGAVTFWAGLVVLSGLGLRDGWRGTAREREVLVVVAVGLVANAAIFGGLSAPADRYQARIAWIVPALAAVWVLARMRGGEVAGKGARHSESARPAGGEPR